MRRQVHRSGIHQFLDIWTTTLSFGYEHVSTAHGSAGAVRRIIPSSPYRVLTLASRLNRLTQISGRDLAHCDLLRGQVSISLSHLSFTYQWPEAALESESKGGHGGHIEGSSDRYAAVHVLR